MSIFNVYEILKGLSLAVVLVLFLRLHSDLIWAGFPTINEVAGLELSYEFYFYEQAYNCYVAYRGK